MPTKKPAPSTDSTSIRSMYESFKKKVASSFGIEDAEVHDIVSGKTVSLAKRKKQLEAVNKGRFGKEIDLGD